MRIRIQNTGYKEAKQESVGWTLAASYYKEVRYPYTNTLSSGLKGIDQWEKRWVESGLALAIHAQRYGTRTP